MNWLSDRVVDHLRGVCDTPDLSETRYELIERIGSGGMGIVYLVRDTLLQRRVALKAVPVDDPELRARIREEARTLATLTHPGIVPVYDMGDLPDGRTFFVMQYLEGLTLDAYRGREPSLSELLRVFQKICDAVAFAHAHSIVHRDLKPTNVMVGKFGQVWVMDWGIARRRPSADPTEREPQSSEQRESTDETGRQGRLGTPSYMAPEQDRSTGLPMSERTDVFGLGALLHFLLTGKPPASIAAEPPPLASVVARATAQDPAGRYASVDELAADIERFLDQEKPLAHRETWGECVERLLRKHYFPITLIAIYIVARIAAFLLLGR